MRGAGQSEALALGVLNQSKGVRQSGARPSQKEEGRETV